MSTFETSVNSTATETMINRSLATQVPVRGEVDARVQVEVEIEVEVEVEIEIEIEIEGTVARCAG